MNKSKLLPLFLALGITFTACSKEESESPAAAPDSGNVADSNIVETPDTTAADLEEEISEPEPEEPDGSQFEAAYEPVLTQYRDYLFQNANPASSDNLGLYWMHMEWELDRRYSRADLKVGYELVDLDGNDIPELLIYHSKVSDFEDVSRLREIYTLEDGAPKMIDQADTQFLLVAYDNAVIEFAGAFYRLEGTEKVEVSADDKSEKLAIGELTMITEKAPETDENKDNSLSDLVDTVFGDVTLPDNITVIGENRSLNAAEAQGFAQALRNMETTPTHVLVIDNGDNEIAMIAGQYNYSVTVDRNDFTTTVLLWTGDQVETSPVQMNNTENLRKLFEENGRYYMETVGTWGSDSAGYLGVYAFDVEYRYFFESGIFEDIRFAHHYITADGTEEMREKLSSLSDLTLADAAIAITRGRYDGHDMSYLHDAVEAQGNTVEHYLLHEGSVQTVSEVPPSNFVMNLDDGQDEPYWNSLDAVLAALES